MRILLAEDDEELRFILSRVLKKEGYTVEEMGDIDELTRTLSGYLTKSRPELASTVLVTDVYMPGGTAIEVVKKFKDHLEDLSILFITSARDPQLTEQGLKLGAHAVLSKPVDMDELKRLLRQIFK